MTVAASDRIWTEVLNYACDVSNMCTVPHRHLRAARRRMRSGTAESRSLQHLKPFGAVGHARKGKRSHKLAPTEEQCFMLGILLPGHGQAKMLIKIVNRQNMSWHPETTPGGSISPTPTVTQLSRSV